MDSLKYIKIFNFILIFSGLILTFTIAMISIIDSRAVDIASGIAPAIFTASLFLAGYISNTIIMIMEKKDAN